MIDALLHGTVDGRPLTDTEISGAIRILILGGFYTTTDATTSTMILLLEHPEIEQQVRRDRSLLPKLFDETLRLESPVISQYRVCTGTSSFTAGSFGRAKPWSSISAAPTATLASSTTRRSCERTGCATVTSPSAWGRTGVSGPTLRG